MNLTAENKFSLSLWGVTLLVFLVHLNTSLFNKYKAQYFSHKAIIPVWLLKDTNFEPNQLCSNSGSILSSM